MDDSASSGSSSSSSSDDDSDLDPELEHSVVGIDVERIRVRGGSGSTGKVLRATVTLRRNSCGHEQECAAGNDATADNAQQQDQQHQQQLCESAPVSVAAVLKLPRSRRRRVIGFGKAAGVLRRELLAFNALRGLQRPVLPTSGASDTVCRSSCGTAPGSSLVLPGVAYDALPHCFGCMGDLDTSEAAGGKGEAKNEGAVEAKVKRKGRRPSQGRGRGRGRSRGRGRGRGKSVTKTRDSGACGILMTRARGVHLDQLHRLDVVCASDGTRVAKGASKGGGAAVGKKSKLKEAGLTILVARIGHRLLRLLRRVHGMGVVHGDLTPSNVLYDPPPGDALSLLGFGHSCVGWQTARAGSRQRGGNRRYVALRKHDAQHKRTPLHPLDDLEAMCYVLLDALGRMPWKGAKAGSRAIRRLKGELAERGAAISREKGSVAAQGGTRESAGARGAGRAPPCALQLESALAQAVHLCHCAQREQQRATRGATPGASTEEHSSWCECYRHISRLLDYVSPLAEHGKV